MAGQTDYLALRELWFRVCEGFMLFYAANSDSSFKEVRFLLPSAPPSLISNVVSSVGSRVDRRHQTHQGSRRLPLCAGRDEERPRAQRPPSSRIISHLFVQVWSLIVSQVSLADAEAFAKKIGCPFISTSTQLKVNVPEAFEAIVRSLIQARLNAMPRGD